MATTSPTRIDDDLYASAKAMGALMSRSASQQIAHWARIGRELEAAHSVSQATIAAVLEGADDYDQLSSEEQAVVRAEWAERIEARIENLDLSRLFTHEAISWAELDEDGRVVRREPRSSRLHGQ